VGSPFACSVVCRLVFGLSLHFFYKIFNIFIAFAEKMLKNFSLSFLLQKI